MELSTALQLAQIVAYIVVGIVFVVMIKADIRVILHDQKVMKDRQDSMSDNVKALTAILTQVAVQDSRLNRIENDIGELKHGKGFVADSEYNLKGKAR